MKNPITILIIFAVSLVLASYRPVDTREVTYQVIFNPNSTIRIIGNTNINSFHCEHTGRLSTDTLLVQTLETGEHQTIKNSEFLVRVDDFDCGIRQMTSDMMDLLKEEDYPFLKIKVLKIHHIDDYAEALTSISIAGKSMQYKVCSTLQSQSNWTSCQGTLDLNIRDFNLEPPTKLFGAVRVKEVISIEFDLQLKIVEV